MNKPASFGEVSSASVRAGQPAQFPRSIEWRGISLVCVIAILGALALAGCSAKESTRASSPQADPQPQPKESGVHDSLPQVGGPAGYVGSTACQECHHEEYASWHRSFHRTMTQVAAAATVQADFEHPVLSDGFTRFTLSRTNDAFWVRMEHEQPIATAGASMPVADARIGLVTGSHHMQVFWVTSEQGNAQVGFPFTWLIPEKRWVPRKATFVRPPDAPHLSELWNVSCSRCHTTAVEPRIDSVHHIAGTRVGELGIACEACHGPGERHCQARRSAPLAESIAPEILAQEIVQPQKIDPVRASQICGFCHSMKWFDKSEGWWEHGFRYRPGDDLEQTTPIIRAGATSQVAGLGSYLEHHPEMLRDFFWPDGMVRVSGRDYNGLIDSPCAKGGKFSCLSCHSLHKSDPSAQLARHGNRNRACTQCHEKLEDEARLAAHTKHGKESAGSECYNCHMPHTTYGVLKAIRSHQVSSPKVADEIASGRPNACNLCHLDKSLAWTADHLHQWFGQSIPQLANDHAESSDAVRLALAGDAGQRALLAWHFGWEPAVQISGRAWIPAVLSQLLDDPYAAVRCVAERSWRSLGLLPPDGYDFARSPAQRVPARDQALNQWSTQIKNEPPAAWPASTRIQANDLEATRAALDTFTQQRDDRPVRLRE